MKQKNTWLITVMSILSSASLATADPETPAWLQSAFSVASANPLSHDGIRAGMTIDQGHWQVSEQLLPVEILRLVQAGDFIITLQPTTDLPPRPAYVTATTTQFQEVSLNGGYRIDNYRGGRPFPLLDPADPRVGEKAAWNFRYRDVPDTIEIRGTMRGVSNTGTIDRSNTGRMRVRYGMDRVGDEQNDPQWETQGVRIKASFEALAPSDMEGNIRITTYYDDGSRPAHDLSYSPQNRRTRKGYVNMLMRMGGGRFDILQEEQPPFFFTGYLHEYNWTYKGEQAMLMPGFLQAEQLTFSGKHNWYPNVPWELRRVVVLEATPKGTHPYSKRIFYLDAQTYTPFCILSYDPQGTFVRLSLIIHANPDFVPGARGIRLPVPIGAVWINVAQDYAYHMTSTNPTFNQDFSPQRFELIELLRRGK